MSKIPRISRAEWQVMQVLWAKTHCTAGEIVDHLTPRTKWNPKTIRTLLGRLVKKEAAGLKADKRPYCYYPLVREEDCVQAESRSFLQRVHGGSINMMLAHFVKQ